MYVYDCNCCSSRFQSQPLKSISPPNSIPVSYINLTSLKCFRNSLPFVLQDKVQVLQPDLHRLLPYPGWLRCSSHMELLVVPAGAVLSSLTLKHSPFWNSTSSRKPSLTTPHDILHYLCPLIALFYNYLFICLSLPFPIDYELFGGTNCVLFSFVLYNQPLIQKKAQSWRTIWVCWMKTWINEEEKGVSF